MIVDKLLTRLEGVKQTGKDRWLAICPAHDDKSPSLAIREVEDRTLLHCFAGCSPYQVVSAIGLELADLFLEKIKTEGHKAISRPFPAVDILRALASDAIFMMVCANDMSKGEKLEEPDKKTLGLIAARFQQALHAGGIAI